jgi:hypothetical protein
MTRTDVIDRNDDFNKTVLADLSKTYTRRRVVDTLLVILIVLGITTIVALTIVDFNLQNSIEHSDDDEISLLCNQLIVPPNSFVRHVCIANGSPPIVRGTNNG